MFIPFFIRHSYSRWPVVTCSIAAALLAILLFFLVLPPWMVEWVVQISHGELLGMWGFDPGIRNIFNYFSYTLVYPNPFLLLLDVAALMLFGWAVERRLGWWQFAILYFASAAAGAAVHGHVQANTVIAGGSAGMFGVMAAGILIYGVSDLEGFAFFAWPAPPKAVFGVTTIWALFGILAYMAGAVCLSVFWPGEDVLAPSLWALGAGFLSGALITAAYLRSQIPLLNPGELDPSTIQRNEERDRKARVSRQLAKDGLFNLEDDENLEERESDTEDVVEADEIPPFAAPASSGDNAQDLGAMKSSLAKMLDLNIPTDLADAYRRFSQLFPEDVLTASAQSDLARTLEKSFYYDLALDAAEKLVWKYPKSPSAPSAMLQAGRLCLHVPGRLRHGVMYIERFLKTEPVRRDVLEAQEVMAELKEAIDRAEADRPLAPEMTPVEEFDEAATGKREDGPDGSSSGKTSGAPPVFHPPLMPGDDEPLQVEGLGRDAADEGDGSPDESGGKDGLGIPDEPVAPVESAFSSWQTRSDGAPPGLQEAHETDGIVVTPKRGKGAPGIGAGEHDNGPRPDASDDEPARAPGMPSSPVVLDLGTDDPAIGPAQSETIAADGPPAFPGIKAKLAPQAASGKPDADALSGVLCSLVFQPKSQIKIGLLARVLSKRLDQPPEGIEDRLRRRKGIVLRDLELDEAREIRDMAKAKGQSLWIVAQTPEVEFPEATEAEMINAAGAQFEWRVGPVQIHTPPLDALMFSAAEVCLDRESRRMGRVMSAFFHNPRQHLRLWESTLRYRGDQALSGSPPGEAFRLVCLRLPDRSPEARVTNSFRRLFGEAGGAAPLTFRTLAEFDDYNQYHILSVFGRQVE